MSASVNPAFGAPSMRPVAEQGFRGLIRRHPVAAFLVWFFVVGQLLAVTPLVLDARGTTVPHQPFIVAATLIGLLLPALVITAVTDGRDGVRRLMDSALRFRAGLGWYLLAVVAIPLGAFLVTMLFTGLPTATSADAITDALVAGLLWQFVLTFLPNNWWEEVAWMGFVQTRLEERHRVWAAAAITGVLFALQHITLVVGSGPVGAVVLMGVLILLAIPFRFLIGWVFHRTGSLFVVGLVHAMGNAATGGSGFGEGMLPRLYPGRDGVPFMAHLITFAVLGLIVVIATRGRLGTSRD